MRHFAKRVVTQIFYRKCAKIAKLGTTWHITVFKSSKNVVEIPKKNYSKMNPRTHVGGSSEPLRRKKGGHFEPP